MSQFCSRTLQRAPGADSPAPALRLAPEELFQGFDPLTAQALIPFLEQLLLAAEPAAQPDPFFRAVLGREFQAAVSGLVGAASS